MPARAMTIRNLLMSLKVWPTLSGMKPAVLMTVRAKKPKINQGITFVKENFAFSCLCSSLDFMWALIRAKTMTVGMMTRVRVSLTMVAKSPAPSEKA